MGVGSCADRNCAVVARQRRMRRAELREEDLNTALLRMHRRLSSRGLPE